ncbi:hypothetical protein ACEN8K_47525, partial [Variovorax sp. CT11-76]
MIGAPALPGYEVTGSSDLQWFVNRPLSDLVRYRAQSYTRFESGPVASANSLRAYLALPPASNPRT